MRHETEGGSAGFKEAALHALREAEDVLGGVADAVTGFVARAGRDCLEAGDTLVEITAGTLDAMVEVGHDAVQACRGIALGALRGSRSDPESSLTVLAVTSRAVVRHVGRAGGDVPAAVRGLVAGAAEGARELGLDVQQAVNAVSRGAVQGCREFGVAAADGVHDAVETMRELTRGREPGRVDIHELEDTPMFFPGPMVE